MHQGAGSHPTVPTVAVIIPAYNAMAYLPEALNSVLLQTYQNFEVILVNDGSQDNIEAWHAQLSSAAKARVKLLNQPNLGISSARNAGIAHTRSPYVAFLDADDRWHPHKLAYQVAYLEAHPTVALVYSWATAIDERGRPLGRFYAGTPAKRPWAQLLIDNVISTPSTVLVRRSCLAQVGEFDQDLSSYVEDKDLWLRICRAHTVALLPRVLIEKRRHRANTSKRWNEMEAASHRVIEKALAHPPDDLSAADIARLSRRSYGHTYLKLAWKPLQVVQVDIPVALAYLSKALKYAPRLWVSKEFFKLICAIVFLKLLGTQRFRYLLNQVVGLRRFVSHYKLHYQRPRLPTPHSLKKQCPSPKILLPQGHPHPVQPNPLSPKP